jgi:hypothetical protein
MERKADHLGTAQQELTCLVLITHSPKIFLDDKA